MKNVTDPQMFERSSEGWKVASDLEQLNNENESWFTIDYRDEATVEKTFELLQLSPSQEAALRDPDIRPRLWIGKNQQILLFMRGINLNPNSEPEDMVGLRIYFDKNRLVCLRNRKLQAIANVREKIVENSTAYSSLQKVFIDILKALLLRIETHIAKLANNLDDIEDKIDDGKLVQLEELESLRRPSAKLWRYLQPQQDVLKRLTEVSIDWLDDETLNELKEIEDSMTFNLEELSLVKERCQLVEAHINNRLSQRVNTNLYLISIITAIFIPISFLTGLLGINVGGMPGVESNAAFWTVCGILFVLVILEIIYLKKNKWF
ncbi:MAG: hypothetical protein HWE27_01575 [Gammaproteobacteria bacterium]|nr:hypothetical protein [Gammaproteobacteria bacterium]